ncbi:hypothetical protein FSP39_023733 [Pinctada imbricata]|uniref:Helicase superfamily 3 single-stranded DNA/RNA virus domain-containing protein n=1 Tax=Pinctada imbricata TaxID=66713 RepID=A0AA89BPJ6_PINIB|nr:hypothetical protein FSP39_005311 [Pinctada imbricata]KAK3083479.1 hypothetical protein FSP39_023733 [Pinctada imbricata]
MRGDNLQRHRKTCQTRRLSSQRSSSPEQGSEDDIQRRLDQLARGRALVRATSQASNHTHPPTGQQKKAKKKDGKGKNFMLTFQSTCKYELQRYFQNKGGETWMRALAAGNEWGSGFNELGHTHAVIQTKTEMTFKEFRLKWKGPNIGDIQRCQNVKDSVRYVTKEDPRSLCFHFDKDWTSLLVKAYIYAQKSSKLVSTSYPYCSLPPFQQRQFRDMWTQFRAEEQDARQCWANEELELRPWQRQVRRQILQQDDRTVLWIHDEVGGHGKSTLAKYMMGEGAMYATNSSTVNFAYAYKEEKVVIFDFVRDDRDHINYGILECLKNGMMFSAKYESRVKRFTPAKVAVFANFAPDYEKLSADRWLVYNLEDGKLL